jgi:DNA-binding PadR family transcriptional regulator
VNGEQPDPTRLLPLGAPVLHILLALGRERMHGYAVMQAIELKTGGKARVLPGTLYTTLNRMVEDGLVEDTAPPSDAPDDDRRRRYYRVTEFGRRVVAAETERLELLLAVAYRDLIP